MQLRNIGMCEVMIDKAMESGLQDVDGKGALKEKYRSTIMMQMSLWMCYL